MADMPEEVQIERKIHQSSRIDRSHPLFELHERMVGGRIANAKANRQAYNRETIKEATKQLLFSLVRLVRQAFEEEECRQKRAYEQDRHRRGRTSLDEQRIQKFESLIGALEEAISLLPEIEIPLESATGHWISAESVAEDLNPSRKLRALTDRYFESTFDSALQSAIAIREILRVMPGRAKARSGEPFKEALKVALDGYTAFSTQAPGCLSAYGTKDECLARNFCEIVMKAAGLEVPDGFGGEDAFRKRISRLDTN